MPTADLSALLICMSPTDDTRLAANTWQPTACRAGLLEACTTKDETLTKLTTSMRAAALTRRPRLDQGSPSAPCFTVTATVPVVAKGTTLQRCSFCDDRGRFFVFSPRAG